MSNKPNDNERKLSLLSLLRFIRLFERTDVEVKKKHPEWKWKRWNEPDDHDDQHEVTP